MISERTLKQWRKEALQFKEDIKDIDEAEPTTELCRRILRMTQELLDLHLIKKGRKKNNCKKRSIWSLASIQM